jgi:hypothetical protein
MKYHRICLVCREKGADKAISVGKDFSPAPLVSHLQTHHEEYTKYLLLNAKRKQEEPSKYTPNQSTIIDHFPKLLDTRENFKRKFS